MRKMKIFIYIANHFFVNCFPFFKLIHFLNTFLKPRKSNFKLFIIRTFRLDLSHYSINVFSFGFLSIIRRISLPFVLNLEFKMCENISTSWRWRVNDLETKSKIDLKQKNYFKIWLNTKVFAIILLFGSNQLCLSWNAHPCYVLCGLEMQKW